MLRRNKFIVAEVLTTKPSMTTLPPVIAGMNGQIQHRLLRDRRSGSLGALPTVLVVHIFQKHTVQGLTARSVKG